MHHTNTLKNDRILIIDDNPAIHEDIRKILSGRGEHNEAFDSDKALLFDDAIPELEQARFEIDSAFQGQEGLDKVRQAIETGRPYALAFVDVRMPPGWDGIETTARIWEVCPELQVVLCTAYSDYAWSEIAGKLGQNDHLLILKKPFDTVEVLQLAETLARKWTLARQAKLRLADLDGMVNQRTQELRESNERLRQSQKLEAIGQLAGGIAHEIRNPLAVCSSAAQFLLEKDTRAEFLKECAQKIQTGIQKASAIIENLLRFARPSAKSEMAEIDLLQVIQETVTLVKNQAKIQKIEMSAPLLPGSMLINGNASLLQQVFMNLIMNARDAMPRGGELTIATEAENSTVHVEVSDNGVGIPADHLNKIFDPFFTTKATSRGTGLGLAVTYGIIREHSGSIQVDSVVGRGTTFRLEFPAVRKPVNVT